MKPHLTLLFLFVSCTLYSQADRTRYTLAYSLHLSDVAGEGSKGYFDPGLGQSVFATAELSTKRSSRFTIGAGFLQSRMKHSDYHYITHDTIEQHMTNEFFVIPLGVKFNFGSFYIHPEVGANFNYRNSIKSHFLDSEMNPFDKPYDDYVWSPPIGVHFASLMSIGYEIKVGKMTFMTGVKGYFAFNNYYVNTFGAGLMIGLKL